MEFDWRDLNRKTYEKSQETLRVNPEAAVDDFVGVIRVGEINVDVIIRDYGDEVPKLAYSYDFYVANEDTGYGYKEESNIHYDYADGTDLYDVTLGYDDFVKTSEAAIQRYIENNSRVGHSYSLIEKANKPLLIW